MRRFAPKVFVSISSAPALMKLRWTETTVSGARMFASSGQRSRGDGRGDERAHPAVGDDRRPVAEPVEEARHRGDCRGSVPGADRERRPPRRGTDGNRFPAVEVAWRRASARRHDSSRQPLNTDPFPNGRGSTSIRRLKVSRGPRFSPALFVAAGRSTDNRPVAREGEDQDPCSPSISLFRRSRSSRSSSSREPRRGSSPTTRSSPGSRTSSSRRSRSRTSTPT